MTGEWTNDIVAFVIPVNYQALRSSSLLHWHHRNEKLNIRLNSRFKEMHYCQTKKGHTFVIVTVVLNDDTGTHSRQCWVTNLYGGAGWDFKSYSVDFKWYEPGQDSCSVWNSPPPIIIADVVHWRQGTILRHLIVQSPFKFIFQHNTVHPSSFCKPETLTNHLPTRSRAGLCNVIHRFLRLVFFFTF